MEKTPISRGSRESAAALGTLAHFREWVGHLVLDDGEQFELEPFQAAIVRDILAGKPEVWAIIPEGNGKTTLMAAIALYHGDTTLNPFVPIGASSREQAEIMYRQAEGFVLRTPGMKSRFKCQEGYRRIKCIETVGRIQVYAADDRTADGVIPSLALLDELHRHRNLRLYRTWRGKIEKRGGQIATISTAGEPGSEFEETRAGILASATKKTAKGQHIRAESHGVVLHDWAVRDPSEINDMDVVAKANPRRAITAAALARKRQSPTMTEDHWKRFVCNIATSEVHPFIDHAEWKRLGDGRRIEEGRAVCIGADGSRTYDTTVVAWAGRAEDGRIDVDARIFSVRREAAHHVFHEGGKIDFDDVEAFIIDRFDLFKVAEAAYDPRYLDRSAEILDARLPGAAIIAVEPQSKHMRDALAAFHRGVSDGTIRHRGDPAIMEHIDACRGDQDERGWVVRKRRQAKPIDAVIAMALAYWRAIHTEPAADFVFEVLG